MKRIVVGLSAALLMFTIGLTGSWLYPNFTMTGSIACDTSYCIYWFQPTLSSDYQAITVYNEYTSAEKSQYLFESNLSNGKVLERNDRLNEDSEKIGEEGIVQNESGRIRICWTEGAEFWFIDAPSLRLALRFRQSDSFQTALKVNKMTKPTHNHAANSLTNDRF
jgi:hypothetical protein